ncbi:hypothetical protein KKC04_00725 [Patescibacteria group bacterium]|nr:hypothetical protein [Patescibacteria group bacterium]MBU4347216.1 hypothetical protein [Patescibacteria group bacterium]
MLLKEKIIEQVNVRALIQFLGLAGIATFLPFVVHVQWLTGPIVNAILILALFLAGIRSALTVCLVPSLMALSGGLLPAVLAPVVPFIMIGNVILVLSIDYATQRQTTPIYAKQYWVGLVIGAGLKFLFLFLSANVIAKLLIKQELAMKVAQMMSWPQFATAVIGGMIAWVILKRLGRV